MKRGTQISPTVKRHFKCWMLAVILSLIYISNYAQPETEYRVKAVFLYNFTQFIQWPSSAFNSPMDPMVIGILGSNPFGNDLRVAVSGEKANGHYIIVNNYSNISEIRKCHILFITKEDTTDMEQIKALARSQYMLLVSDTSDDFLDKGGMIRFVTRNNKISFQVNLAAIRAANLSISSKMLRLAELVKDD